VYETIHGGTQEAIGVDRANPLPALFPAIELLKGLGETRASEHILKAIESVMVAGQVRTPDLGGKATTTEMTNAIVDALNSRP
jgi:isocitrate/isopropylmalate dehydrogenase